ncbi:7701_t:CDS:2, partial [Ambispora leptoticha]
ERFLHHLRKQFSLQKFQRVEEHKDLLEQNKRTGISSWPCEVMGRVTSFERPSTVYLMNYFVGMLGASMINEEIRTIETEPAIMNC